MKATGIVRRIDDLGRVVIPKEIRRTLHIREGDPLEIFTAGDGAVVFQKYSPLGELDGLAERACQVLTKVTGWAAAVCDRDQLLTCTGPQRRELREQPVSAQVSRTLESRRLWLAEQRLALTDCPNSPLLAAAAPILAGGDVLGGVLLLAGQTEEVPGPAEQKVLQAVALLLGRQMEL